MRLGLQEPPEPATYLYVYGAPLPASDAGATTTTFADYLDAKSSLGDARP
jgi:hypothetical protein